MPNVLTGPLCLHVPELVADDTALLTWEPMENAERYELECAFDEDFEAALAGLTWQDLEEEGNTWAALDQDTRWESWQALEALPAQGLTWQSLNGKVLSWEAFETLDLSWWALCAPPADLAVYRGAGLDADGPDAGLNWLELDAAQSDWAAIEAADRTWAAWERLAGGGRSWRGLEGKYLDWDALESRQMTWQEFEQLPPEAGPHKGCLVTVPPDKRTARYRVRALGADGAASAWFESTPQSIIIRAVVRLPAEAGQAYELQMDGLALAALVGRQLTVRYDAQRLALEDFAVQSGPGQAASTALARVYRNTPGTMRLGCERAVGMGRTWAGLVTRLGFRAKKPGATPVTLEQRSI